MSQILQKIIRKPLTATTIRSILTHQNPTQTLIPNLIHHSEPSVKSPILESLSDEKLTHFNRVNIYPSFSFGYFLNPISSSGLPGLKPEEGLELDGSDSGNGMMWADSVKKKRKKKMNKHKLKKLKKRLRHCS